VASVLSITTPSVIEGARVWSSTDISIAPRHVTRRVNGEGVLSINDSTKLAQRTVALAPLSRSSSPSTRTWNRESSWPSAPAPGAYTVNHHLARVKANLEARSSERDDLTDEGTPRQPSTPLALLDSLLLHQRIQRLKNGQSE